MALSHPRPQLLEITREVLLRFSSVVLSTEVAAFDFHFRRGTSDCKKLVLRAFPEEMPMTQECVDCTLFSIHLKILYNVPCYGSHCQLKQKTFKQWLCPPRSSHTQAMEPSVKLDEMGNVSALCVEEG